MIDDVRRQSLIGMAGYERALVKKAKEAGGDAIVFLDSHSEIVGYYNSGTSGTATTTGTAYRLREYRGLSRANHLSKQRIDQFSDSEKVY